MSESLTRSIHDMTITSHSSTQTVTSTEPHRPVTDHPQPTRIKAPVSDEIVAFTRKNNRGVIFYGCDVPPQWLVDYAKQHARDEVKCSTDILLQVQHAFLLIKRRTGIKTLTFEEGLVDPLAPPDTYIVDPGRYGPPHVPLLSAFTSESSSFRRRPSQEQVDLLAEIVGRQPRWWVDYEDTYE